MKESIKNVLISELVAYLVSKVSSNSDNSDVNKALTTSSVNDFVSVYESGGGGVKNAIINIKTREITNFN